MDSNLAERRSALSASIAALEREHGAAVLDGNPFDPGAVSALRGELDAIDAAESEAARREADAAAAERRKALEAATVEAGEVLLGFISASEAAHAHCSGLAGALKDMVASRARLAPLARQLGLGSPPALDAREMEIELSHIVLGSMKGVGASGYSFGNMRVPSLITEPTWGALSLRVANIFKPLTEANEGSEK